MSLSPASHSGFSLPFIEGSLTLIAVVTSIAWPRLAIWFLPIERALARLARRKMAAVIAVGATALVLRLAILPLFPIPLAFTPNDFSVLLASDTFAHGRLTNPTPAMWVHFESIHIDMKPTYMSMYFPGTGLLLAAGKVFLGNPWFAQLAASTLMCAAICWMLQAWLPPGWALLGGALAVLRLGIFSYWLNTYSGGALVAALGGALVLGALARFLRSARLRYTFIISVGAVLMALTRPYEGVLLCLPVVGALVHWLLTAGKRLAPGMLFRLAAVPLALLFLLAVWMGYYDFKVFGNPFTLPYTINRATYAIAPYYIWQSPRPAPSYRHEALRRFYEIETRGLDQLRTPRGFIRRLTVNAVNSLFFFTGFALLPPLFMARRVILDHRTRFLFLCFLIMLGGMSVEIFVIPHYLSPFTTVLYALGLQAMRHLWQWKPEQRPAGRTVVRLLVALIVFMASIRMVANPLHLEPAEWPPTNWTTWWYGPGHFGTERAQVESRLEQLPGDQLAVVRYLPNNSMSLDEWVYNAADITHSKVIWAREMNSLDNEELFDYYRDRTVWLVQPDMPPSAVLMPYPLPRVATSHSGTR